MSSNYIEAYQASYPVEYYEVGKVYSFYKSRMGGRITPAETETINNFSGTLNSLKKSTNDTSFAVDAMALERFYGVVVNKEANKLTVLVMLSDGSFGIMKYAANYHGVSTDGKDLMQPKVSISGNKTSKAITVPSGGNISKNGPAHQPITIVEEGPAHQPITIDETSGNANKTKKVKRGAGVITLDEGETKEVHGVITLDE